MTMIRSASRIVESLCAMINEVRPSVTDSSWTLGGIKRDIPIIASAMDGVVDVGMCVELIRQGALGVLNLEGVQCRYDDPNPVLDRMTAVGKSEFVGMMQSSTASRCGKT